MKKLRFLTMFPECRNVHLIKDVGMLPYILKQYYGYDSSVACYDNDNYEYLNTCVRGLKRQTISKGRIPSTLLDGVLFLLAHAKEIDVLQLYHALPRRNGIWILFYKLLNPKGMVYLKLDASKTIFDSFRYPDKGIKGFYKSKVIKSCDFITAEVEGLAKELTKQWNREIEYIPNGFYDYGDRKSISIEKKENIICTVGRLGTYEKNTQELLEAFAVFAESHPDWRLHLIGRAEKELDAYMEEYYRRFPGLRERIDWKGEITDREQLDEEYAKAKIFCLTSRFESFGIVLVEALKNGCYLITSDINGAEEKTNGGVCGRVYTHEKTGELIQALEETCDDSALLKRGCEAAPGYAYGRFYWPDICQKVDRMIQGKRK